MKEKSLNEDRNKNKEKEKELIGKEQSLKEKEKKYFDDFNNKINEYKEKEKYLIDKENKINIDIKNKLKEIKIMEDKIKEKEDKIKYEKLQFDNEKLIFENEKNKLEKEIIKIENSKLPTLIGLNNIGATCYMNATLQAFSNTEKLTEYFLTKYQFNPDDETKTLSNEYYKLLTNLWDEEKKKGAFSPYDFKDTLSKKNNLFRGIQANDSKDLINFLLEELHTELNNPIINQQNNNINVNQLNEMSALNYFLQDFKMNFNSIISNLFYGVLETKSQCTGCGNIKYNFQVYSFLEFPLEQVNYYYYQKGQRNLVNYDGKNPEVKLFECFEYYRKVDLMTGDNQMYCNVCNATLNSYYSTSLYSLPHYLIINLNRGKNAAYQCKVDFPDQLNLINYISYKEGITVLKLYAVICHFGESSMSGHFMAYCKNSKDNNWYLYNDGIVTLCKNPFPYNNGMPYILFYKAV